MNNFYKNKKKGKPKPKTLTINTPTYYSFEVKDCYEQVNHDDEIYDYLTKAIEQSMKRLYRDF